MAVRSRMYRAQVERAGGQAESVGLDEAIAVLKRFAEVKVERKYKGSKKRKGFDQTVELVMHLGIDPRQADQAIRGAVALPHGIGKTRRVIAFCPDDVAEKARAAGAAEAGAADLVKKISDGWSDFDVAVAHPSVMGKVGKLGRILGPQGKMPSPKAGTVTPDIETAVREYSAGKVEYRNDAGGSIHVGVGKVSFPAEKLKENIEAFIGHMRKVRPTAAKGHYIKRVTLSSTMSPGVSVAVS